MESKIKGLIKHIRGGYSCLSQQERTREGVERGDEVMINTAKVDGRLFHGLTDGGFENEDLSELVHGLNQLSKRRLIG